MWGKWTALRPIPMPRSGRFQRFMIARRERRRPRHTRPPGTNVAFYLPEQPFLPEQLDFSFFVSVCVESTGTLQPPLPLQEFLPAQPLSPPLQPPIPLQSFLPLQSCLAEAQPPLPLHEFLPEQPASPLLQPPLPLQSL